MSTRIRWVEHEDQTGSNPTRWSNFWIMINTNRAEADPTNRSHVISTLRMAVNRVFSSNATAREIFNVIDENGKIETDPDLIQQGLDRIEDIETEAVVEVGSRQHRVHSHVLIMVQHKSRIQINVPKLRDLIREYSIEDGEPMFINPAVKLKFIRQNPINAIKRYQRGYKGLPAGLSRQVISHHGNK